MPPENTKERKRKLSKKDIEQTINTYSDTLYKICFLILKNEADVKDVLQETETCGFSNNDVL